VYLATRSPATGRTFSPESRRAIVLHELGHALGLPHSTSAGDVMYPVASTNMPSDRDRFSLRLLYELPSGWIGTATRGQVP
jgi:predicted Zn-dependent protease